MVCKSKLQLYTGLVVVSGFAAAVFGACGDGGPGGGNQGTVGGNTSGEQAFSDWDGLADQASASWQVKDHE